MKRELVVAVGLVLIASTVTAVVGHANPAGPVYTVAQVQSGLYRNPQAWAGRTVRVRAQMETLGGDGTPQPLSSRPSLYDNLLSMPPGSRIEITLGPPPSPHADVSASFPAVSLFVGPRVSDPLLSALQRLPVIARVVPAPDFESTPQNLFSPKIFVLRLLPRGEYFDALLLDVS